MKQNRLLAKAISIAAQAHEKQFDKGGNAYILHPMRILMRLRTKDAELMHIAILHDVIEDTHWTTHMLKTLGYSGRVLKALRLLTHTPDMTYGDYIREVATNKDATLIKLEDLRDNSDITRLKGTSEKDFERMAKYHKAFIFLGEQLGD